MDTIYFGFFWTLAILCFILSSLRFLSLKKKYGINLDKIGTIIQIKASLIDFKNESVKRDIKYIKVTRRLQWTFFLALLYCFSFGSS